MEKKFLEIFEQDLSQVLSVISRKVSDTEICVVNDNLKNIRVIKGQLEEGLELKCVRMLDPDEMKLFAYLRLQEVALKSSNRHLSMLEKLSESVIEQLLNLHFLSIITSSEIKANIIGFTVSKGFWLHAVMEKKNLKNKIERQEERTLVLLSHVFLMLEEIDTMRQAVNHVEMLEQIQNMYPNEHQHRSSEDKSMRPFALKKEVIDCVQQVYISDGTFIATEHGWLPIRRGGKLYKDYPVAIPFSSQNDNVVFTFYPGLKK